MMIALPTGIGATMLVRTPAPRLGRRFQRAAIAPAVQCMSAVDDASNSAYEDNSLRADFLRQIAMK